MQFRELEFLSGAKDASYLRRFRGITDDERARLERRLAEPTLWDAFVAVLGRRGLAGRHDEAVTDVGARRRARPRVVRRRLGAGRGAARSTTSSPRPGGPGTW